MLDFEESDKATKMAISISILKLLVSLQNSDLVKHGEEVTILEAGVAIARLVPAPKQRSPEFLDKTRGKSSHLTLTLLTRRHPQRFSELWFTVSMRVLLDTHAFIWWVTNDFQLLDAARACADPDNVFQYCKRLRLSSKSSENSSCQSPPESYIPSRRLVSNQFESLPIQMNHVLQVSALPNHHRDPFDRILIAQSQVEEMPILTADDPIGTR